MQLSVDQIPAEGVDLSLHDAPPWAVDAASEGLSGQVQHLTGHLHVTRVEDLVRVRGELSARASRSCDRCGEDGELTIGGPVELDYVPSSGLTDGVHDLQAAELDLGFYDGGVLDLVAVVQEHFALALPFRLACDVPGFVLADGQPCTWQDPSVKADKPIDPRFAVLQGLKLDN
ncbi:MAG: DUF177 domain-containing protein [Alphaproteobacteria bacterium]|nr:DUF177 domain-containing protein [Alphaproteobacteria bacterium]